MNIRLLIAAVLFTAPVLFSAESAQPALPVATLRIGSANIRAEVADNDAERSSGLMFRESLAPDSGMLFVMPSLGPAAFWMKNTLIPLSVAFLDENGTIMEIHDMQPKSEKIVKSAFSRIAYALEMQQGWFGKKNIWPGERVSGLPPPLRE
jgi:uncharacterized protein